MSGIACGHCGGRHPTVAEVRSCSADHPASPDPPPPDPSAPPDPGNLRHQSPFPGSVAASSPTDPADPGNLRHQSSFPGSVAASSTGAEEIDRLAGPDELGRSLLIWADDADGTVADPWKDAPRVRIDPASANAADLAHQAWRTRTRTVFELAGELPPPDPVLSCRLDELSPDTDLAGERLRFALLANTVDGRDPQAPRFEPLEAALRLGASVGGPGDVETPDGTGVLCDGGPLGKLPSDASLPIVPSVHLERGSLAPLTDHPVSADLADDQLAAVAHHGGGARIIAPAGSGKTRVLTERARHLLTGWSLTPNAVCLVAFNVRARAEMEERTTDLSGLQIRTLNSLALAICNGTGPFAGTRRPRCSVIDERQVRGILSDLVKTRRQAMADPFATWIEALTAARLGLRSPAAIEGDFGGDVKGFAEVFPRYRAILEDRNLVDFDEQIVRAIEILLTEPAARHAARRACRLMLVDEFQDLAPAHLLLVRLVAGPAADVFGVGDDDQTIYGYAGASPDWLIDFDRYFPGAGTHDLQVNYRCPPAVVTAADTLLTHNRRRVTKTIHAAPGRTDGPSALVIGAHDDPLDQLVDQIRQRIDAGARPGDIAVLTRVNATLLGPMVGLHGAGIPATRPLNRSFLDRTGVAAVLAWMRLATGPAKRLSSEALAAAARRPPRGLSYRMVEWIAEKQSVGELEAMANRMRDERDQVKIRDLATDLDQLRHLVDDGATTAELLAAIRDDIGLGTALEQRLDASRRSLDRSAHGDDLTSLATLATRQPDPAAFPAWLATQLDEADHDPHGVQLATVHKVKGREWPEVIVFEATAGLFPHRLASDREEERRVFHVALTRGSDRVTVLSGRPASPFVGQLSEPADPDAPPEPELERPARAGATAPKKKREVPPTDSLLEGRLREQLKEWRRKRSSDDGVPAYVVFADATMYELARLRPGSRAALLDVPGIGPAKADRYGDELIALLADPDD